MSERKLRLWSTPRPEGEELDRRLRQTLGITRAGGYRKVRDPWGEYVRVEIDRVRSYVVAHTGDPTRWRLVPLIIPTIKKATDRYEKGRGRVYEAKLRISHREGPYERTAFVQTVVEIAPTYLFASILSPISDVQARTEKAVERQRKRAGRRSKTRPNPWMRAYKGDPGLRRAKVGRQSPPGGSSHAHKEY